MMKIYQLNGGERYDFKINEVKNAKNVEELVKIICRYRHIFDYNMFFGDITIYLEDIPKRLSKYKELTIVIDLKNHNIRYFSSLCGAL